ncbi:DUF2381 family protein [Myxococcus sp. RHSTA-1-4]|uniref:DUF2381 family protein n=1 Tax=Myxococcus sp. RHSTA-1-4 TaxID=2874601 RepID=UPI001CC0B288|nr:DUF2381 family protein [Myxococcus sp. RHSTA-1-4]MBZ4423321.1 DUF2381 family protein [Myxococcus sp. RHSTA-1-4]
MLQPVRLALALVLLGGAAPRADAATPRTKRERPVAVVGNPAEPLPEVRVEAAAPTVLFFPTMIAESTLTVDEQPRTVDTAVGPGDGSRIRVLDVGKRSIIVQPVEDLRPGERHELTVLFADGRAPARAAFVLVTDPAEADARIDVERRELPSGPCPADAPRAPPRPEDFVLLGYVDENGVRTGAAGPANDEARGLRSSAGGSYRGKAWALVDVMIWNAAGQQPWAPREATFTSKRGVTLRARVVTVGGGEIAPGAALRVLAVVDALPKNAGEVFTLEVRGSGGRSLVIPDVRFMEGDR